MAHASLIWEGTPPKLRSPALVSAFAGWNDAASSSSAALEAMAISTGAEVIARIDPEDFFDFQANRPTISVRDGVSRTVNWPANTIMAAHCPGADRDLVLVNGTEPSMRWNTFCELLLQVAEDLEVDRVITLGALIADVIHTRPVPITGLATDPELAEAAGLDEVNYEGPTGITGVFHHVCRQSGMRAASLFAAVPHYAATVTNPKAALTLTRRVEAISGIAFDASSLESAVSRFETQLDRAVAANPEIKEIVEHLESEQDDDFDGLVPDVPSGDAIASELQRFLRQHGTEEPDPEE